MLFENGLSYTAVMREVGGNVTTWGIRGFSLCYQKTESIENVKVNSWEKYALAIDDRWIKQICHRDRQVPSAVISSELSATAVFVSARTLQRKLTKIDVKGRIPRKKAVAG